MADFSRKSRFYIAGVVALGLGLAVWQFWGLELSSSLLLAWFILGVLDLLCELFEVQLMAKHMSSASIAVGVSAVLIGGPKLGLLVVLTSSSLAELFLRRQLWKRDPNKYGAVVLFNVFQLVNVVVLAGLLFQALGGQSPPYKSLVDFVRAAFLFFVFLVLNHAIVAGVVHFSQGLHYWRHLRTTLRVQHVQSVSLGILAILIAVTYAASPWYTFLMLSPLFVVQFSLWEHLKLREQAKQTFEKIAQIVNTRDPYTGVHSEEVAKLAVKLAQALKLPPRGPR
ncbi:MAG: hypothetical protein ACUVQS_02760 [Candidatus Bipolaricaulaceae bacterium]